MHRTQLLFPRLALVLTLVTVGCGKDPTLGVDANPMRGTLMVGEAKVATVCTFQSATVYRCWHDWVSADGLGGHAFVGIKETESCREGDRTWTQFRPRVAGMLKTTDLSHFTTYLQGKETTVDCEERGTISSEKKMNDYIEAVADYCDEWGTGSVLVNVVVPGFTRPCKRTADYSTDKILDDYKD